MVDPAKLRALADFQLGWFWKIFNVLRFTPNCRLPFDANFFALAGARTRGYWENHSAPVLACFRVESIAGQKWIWHEGLVRLSEAGSQSEQSSETMASDVQQHALFKENRPKTQIYSLKELFLQAYKNYPKHIEKAESETAFFRAVEKYSKQQKVPAIDYAEFIATKCSEYAEATRRAGIPKQFIPYMGKWLRRGRFLDDPSEWVVSYDGGDDGEHQANSGKTGGPRPQGVGRTNKPSGAYRGTDSSRFEREPDIIVD